MSIEIEDLRNAKIVDERFEYSDFEVTATNYDPKSRNYFCENSHNSPEPALFLSGISYNPSSGNFEMRGSVVYQCHVCQKPVFLDDDD